MRAFYFSNKDNRLRYGDNRLIEKGITHTVEGEIGLCDYGLHASVKLIDALSYAPGSNLWLVELGGEIINGYDKCCATERTYIDFFDAESLLREFARKQALINIEKIKPYCSEDEYSIILKWLNTGYEAHRSAAESAARSAARSAAWSAARSAAWSAAESAAWSAARSAAWSAAESAAWSAAESAAWSDWSAANDMLTEMIRESTGWDIPKEQDND